MLEVILRDDYYMYEYVHRKDELMMVIYFIFHVKMYLRCCSDSISLKMVDFRKLTFMYREVMNHEAKWHSRGN